MHSQLQKTVSGLVLVAAVIVVSAPTNAFAFKSFAPKWQEAEAPMPKATGDKSDDAEAEPEAPKFDPSRKSIIPEVPMRAWELNPYQVLVWICIDGSPRLNSVYPQLEDGILRRSELADPSGWNVHVQQPPAEWRNRMRRKIETAEEFEGIQDLPELANADKLVVVTLSDTQGKLQFKVREFDVQTQQWGAIVRRESGQLATLDRSVFGAITKAFMPLARIDRVGTGGEVLMRARAVNSCVRAVQNAAGAWTVAAITSSPVWIRSNDRFLPIIRRVDRQGQLSKLEPIDSTFLTIDSQEGFNFVCSIQSSRRTPLGQRSSRRAQKLALVIRPPENPTDLKLVSKDDETVALSGYEIWSRRPGQPREEPSDLLGVTDWRGILSIPPAVEGLRLIYIKRGQRPLKKLPIIPGLFPFVQTTVPDDETRLYAEGIIKGIQTEVLNLVAQRQVYETQIGSAIKAKKYDEASDLLERYQSLTSPQELKNRMGDEEARLKSRTADKRELEQISSMFSGLRVVLSTKVGASKVPKLREQLQIARRQETN